MLVKREKKKTVKQLLKIIIYRLGLLFQSLYFNIIPTVVISLNLIHFMIFDFFFKCSFSRLKLNPSEWGKVGLFPIGCTV